MDKRYKSWLSTTLVAKSWRSWQWSFRDLISRWLRALRTRGDGRTVRQTDGRPGNSINYELYYNAVLLRETATEAKINDDSSDIYAADWLHMKQKIKPTVQFRT